MRVSLSLCVLAAAATAPTALGFLPPAAAPAPSKTALQASRQEMSRADVLLGGLAAGAAALTGGLALPSLAGAEDAAPAAAVELGPAPTNFALSKEYYKDAAQMLSHMKYATFMNRDTPNYENIAKSVKTEMTDFVSYYRRFNNVAGKPSFSTLYTAINVMAGHYASYGPKFPIPEKRRKRLQQEFTEIDRNIRRNR